MSYRDLFQYLLQYLDGRERSWKICLSWIIHLCHNVLQASCNVSAPLYIFREGRGRMGNSLFYFASTFCIARHHGRKMLWGVDMRKDLLHLFPRELQLIVIKSWFLFSKLEIFVWIKKTTLGHVLGAILCIAQTQVPVREVDKVEYEIPWSKCQIITACQRCCGKVLFSQVSVCPQGDGGRVPLEPGPFLVASPFSFPGDHFLPRRYTPWIPC